MIEPVGYRVLVRTDDPKQALKNDLIEIPQHIQEAQRIDVNTGIVLGYGKQCWVDVGDGTPWVAVGDHIIYARYGGKRIEDPETGEWLLLLNDKDVIGLVSGV